MKVKVRKEQNRYLGYFIDSRRIVEINELGAVILDLLFNQGKDVGEITSIIINDYGIPLSQAKSDIVEFLSQIKKEILPDSFNVMGQEQLDLPLGIELEITTSCNLCCRHCFQEFHDGMSMPTEKAVGIINQLADHQLCEVSLIGGEPFKHPDLMNILRCCQDREMAINLVTNATLIDEVTIKELVGINRLFLAVSLDGTQEIHDYIRGRGTFKKVDSVLRRFCVEGIAVEITCTLNSVNLPNYRDVVEYCEKLGIPCNFNLFKPFRPEHKRLVPDPNRFFEVIADLFRLRRDKGYKIGLPNAAVISELLGLSLRNECRAALSGTVIDVMGRMITCPSLVAAGYYKEKELPFFDDNFMDTWRNNEIFVRFRQNGFLECQARSFIFSKNVQGRDPYGITAFREWRSKE